MPGTPADILARPLDELAAEVERLCANAQHNDCSDRIDAAKATEILTRARAAIERLSGGLTSYRDQAKQIFDMQAYEQYKLLRVIGVVRSLSADIKAGYLRTIEELIHGELFADFLDMADHLLEAGYKDAAAVVAGSALEAHIRQLGKRTGVSLEITAPNGDVRPKTADLLNADLEKVPAYGKLDQ